MIHETSKIYKRDYVKPILVGDLISNTGFPEDMFLVLRISEKYFDGLAYPYTLKTYYSFSIKLCEMREFHIRYA
jgi:hypothetical protein